LSLVAQHPFCDAAAFQDLEKPQDRAITVAQTDPALQAFDDLALVGGDSIQLVHDVPLLVQEGTKGWSPGSGGD
jgi:hypothetical protein